MNTTSVFQYAFLSGDHELAKEVSERYQDIENAIQNVDPTSSKWFWQARTEDEERVAAELRPLKAWCALHHAIMLCVAQSFMYGEGSLCSFI